MSSELRVSGAFITDISATLENAVVPLSSMPRTVVFAGSQAVVDAADRSAQLQAALGTAVTAMLTDAAGGARVFVSEMENADRQLASSATTR
ncbi:hypothetical protein [Agromyces laixinhei]|uniref:hypothetical protein n=1 Tax=Agromyces laixinhei TaxID=2585717 RepID=UPI001116B038|nr:hypothetical protein [Agromyces laixinhei]